jgi:hypothetical protein
MTTPSVTIATSAALRSFVIRSTNHAIGTSNGGTAHTK